MSTFAKYQCIIVEDEPIARKIVRNYIAQLPMLSLIGEFKNAIETLDFIKQTEHVDIAFLDINMPQLNGMSLAKLIDKKTKIIFTTAYSNYAVESYEINTVDYLLKPFTFERFTKAVYKIIDSNKSNLSKASEQKNDNVNEQKIIHIKSEGKIYPILVDEIVYCEANKNYTIVFLLSGTKLNPLITLSKFETEIACYSSNFMKIHRSFIISKKYITAIASNYILLGSNKIPIGDFYKNSVMNLLEK